jgi:uncharacterized membrane protein
VRLPAVLLGSLTVGAAYFLGREFAGNRGAVVLASLFLVSDVAVRVSQDARHYALLSLCLVVLLIGATRLFRRLAEQEQFPELLRANAGAFALIIGGTVACLYAHTLSVYYVASLFGGAVAYALVLPAPSKRLLLLSLSFVAVTSLALWTPWLLVFLDLLGRSDTYQLIEQPSFAEALDTTSALLGVGHIWRFGYLPELVFLILIASGGMRLAGSGHRGLSILLAAGFLLTPFLVWATAYVRQPIFVAHYIAPAHVFGLVLLGGLLMHIRAKPVPLMLGVLVFSSMLVSLYGYYSVSHKSKEQWRETARYLQEATSSEDIIVVCKNYLFKGPLYYWRQPHAPFLVVSEGKLWHMTWEAGNEVMNAHWLGIATPALPPFERGGQPFRDVYLVNRRKSCEEVDVTAAFDRAGLTLSSFEADADFINIRVERARVLSRSLPER